MGWINCLTIRFRLGYGGTLSQTQHRKRYEGAPVEHVKEGLRDVADECLLVIIRRPPEPDDPDAGLENILPGSYPKRCRLFLEIIS